MLLVEKIQTKITEKLNPHKLEIYDDSAKHKGHSGAREGGETHFTILIVSNIFENQSRIARHKIIYELLSAEIKERIHALSIKALTLQEYNNLTH